MGSELNNICMYVCMYTFKEANQIMKSIKCIVYNRFLCQMSCTIDVKNNYCCQPFQDVRVSGEIAVIICSYNEPGLQT